MDRSLPGLAAGIRRRDRRALARTLTLVEDEAPLPAWNDDSGDAAKTLVVGVTGGGGAGKSTLVAAFLTLLRNQDKSVAVLACDPQSPRTGGALLGDRIRAQLDPGDEGVYFRSLSTRGFLGGISRAVGPSLVWLRRFGFDFVLIETVGVGQDQAAVRDLCDVLLLLVTPHTGDEVQWEKAGLLELADLVAVNKADLPAADRVRQQLEQALSLDPAARKTPVLKVAAATGAGVPELWQAVLDTGTALTRRVAGVDRREPPAS